MTSIRPQDKLYYTIKEASKIVGEKEYVLRYWETEFTQLSPTRNARGRIYTKSDIDLVLKIKHLLHEKGMTIKGAKAHLSANSKFRRAENALSEVLQHLKSLREFLSNFAG